MKSLKAKLILFIGIIIILSIGLSTYLTMKIQRKYLLDSKINKLNIITNTIEKSLHYDMSQGRSDRVQKIVEMIGGNGDICEVRIFSQNGKILKSSNRYEINKTIKPAIFNSLKEKNTIVFHDDFSERNKKIKVLSMIRPIFNQFQCVGCHSAKKKILGVLDVGVSIDNLESKISYVQRYMLVFALLTIILITSSIIFLMRRFVDRPIKNLVGKMEDIEGGDLETRIDIDRDDEMGKLCKHFNRMTERLNQYQKDVEKYHQEQMQRADRLASLGELTSIVSHEIKNPLTGLRGAVKIFKDECSRDDPKRDVLNEILNQIDRVFTIIKDVLFYSKAHPSQLVFSDINKLLDESLLLIGPLMEKKKICLIKDFDKLIPEILVDKNQIKQVFLNIFINSLQATPHGGFIEVKTGLKEDDGEEMVFIDIRDTGKGISEQTLKEVFKPFFSTKEKGTGLGLAIVRRIIHNHNGTIFIESELKKGTTVRILLPNLNRTNICGEKAS